jgi:hypothetical protein
MYRRLLPALSAVLAVLVLGGCVGKASNRSSNEQPAAAAPNGPSPSRSATGPPERITRSG